MTIFSYGKRIKSRDNHLVLRFALTRLFPLFFLTLALFHGRTLLQLDWHSLPETLQEGDVEIYLPSLLVCLLSTVLFKRYFPDTVKQVIHRQKLARMLLENKWYESEQVQSDGLLDEGSSRSKEKITYFPKMYYKLKDGLIHIRVEISALRQITLVENKTFYVFRRMESLIRLFVLLFLVGT